MTRKTILIFTDWYKPGFKAGGPVQSVFNLASLLCNWMDVKVITRNTDLNSNVAYPQIAPNAWIQISQFHHVMYLDAANTNFKNIKSLIKENKSNVIYINGLFSMYFSFIPAFLCSWFSCQSVFISVRGMLHRSALSVKPFKKQLFLAFARGFGLYSKPILIASNEEEKNEIIKSLRKAHVKIAPNIPLISEDNSTDFVFKDIDGALRVLFLGRIAPEKNPIALIKALCLIDFPIHVKFCGGYNNPDYFQEFKSLLSSLPSHVKAEYLGELPNTEINSLLLSNDLMALPSLGENFGHAIYESLALSIPVIIGNNTPWNGIESNNAGIEISPNDINAMAAALVKFNEMSAIEFANWKVGAKNMAKQYMDAHDFKSIYSQLFS
ncbi:MAG: glycosyltransferase family 4 protein [Bacteroidia bacterium]|nr:glycosyltransferase family 4 protein [Bacteroidia bacterium]